MSTWLYAAPVVVAVGSLLVWLKLRFNAAKPVYLPLPGGLGVYRVSPAPNSPTPVTPELISAALQTAATCMSKVWPAQAVKAAMTDCGVWVRAEESQWSDGQQQVGGQLIGKVLVVARNLSGLAHELAHLLRRELDDQWDDTHDGWASRGIEAAVDEYQAWLMARPKLGAT